MTNTENQTDARAAFTADPAVRAVAFWATDDGSTHVWPQATVDNRPSRVLARIVNRLGYAAEDVLDFEVIVRP